MTPKIDIATYIPKLNATPVSSGQISEMATYFGSLVETVIKPDDDPQAMADAIGSAATKNNILITSISISYKIPEVGEVIHMFSKGELNITK